MIKRTRIVLLAVLAAALAVPAALADGGHVSLVAYSTPGPAFAKLIPAFQATAAGKGVSVDQSYGAAEAQVKAIQAGLPADIVDFALADNVNDLVKTGLVAPNVELS